MNNQHPVWRMLAQVDAEEIEAIHQRATEVLAPFLLDEPSIMGLSEAIADIWPMLFLQVERAVPEPQRHEIARAKWREIAKRELGVDLSRPVSKPQGIDL